MPANRQLAQQARRNRERNSGILQWQGSAIPASLPVLGSSSYELAIATMASNRQLVQQARRNRERNSIEQQQRSSIPTDLVPAVPASSSHEPIILATTLTVKQLVEQAERQLRRRHLIHRQLPTNPAAPSPEAQIIATNPVSMNRLQLAQQARRTQEYQSQQQLPIARQPLTLQSIVALSLRHQLGPCHVPCRFCGADHWIEERVQGSAKYAPRFATCCKSGAIMMERFQDPPQPLFSLLIDMTPGIYFTIH